MLSHTKTLILFFCTFLVSLLLFLAFIRFNFTTLDNYVYIFVFLSLGIASADFVFLLENITSYSLKELFFHLLFYIPILNIFYVLYLTPAFAKEIYVFNLKEYISEFLYGFKR